LHIGLWHGMQRQVLANVSSGGFGTLKHTATMAVLFIGPAHAWLYATTFATVAMLEVFTNAWLVRRTLGERHLSEDAHALTIKPFLREVSVLSAGILVGLMVSQMDRFILSRSVSLEDFGVYTVVATLALAFLQLQAPMTRAYFPLLVQDIQSMGRVSTKHIKRLFLGTLGFSTFPTLLAAFFAKPLLDFWLHAPKFVELGHRPMQLILLAVAVNTIYNCIYQVMVAAGQSHLVLKFNLAVLTVAGLLLAATAVSNQPFGLLLGGMIWLTTTITQLVLGLVWYTQYELQPDSIKKTL
jgi:O-antigen/teichoic acid export membrane protein